MPQRIFTFRSPVDTNEMINIITRVVSELEGKTQIDGNVVTAKWRSYKYQTIFSKKFTFYVGKDVVRVVTNDSTTMYGNIKWEFKCAGIVQLWDEFVRFLTLMFPNLNFEIKKGVFHIVSANIISDGVEQTFSSTSTTSPSISRALIGGALFGGAGAIVGGSRSKTHTSGTTKTVFSKDVLVAVRYSNGLNIEGSISKTSTVYHQILANLSELSGDTTGGGSIG